LKAVTLYTRRECPLCRDAEDLLAKMGEKIPFSLRLVDIDGNQEAHDRYFDRIPVVTVDGREVCSAPVDERRLRKALTA
jgi:glutaredoxin